MGPKPDFVNNVITLAHLKADNKATAIGVSSGTKPNLFLSVCCIFCSMKGNFFQRVCSLLHERTVIELVHEHPGSKSRRSSVLQALVNAGRWVLWKANRRSDP